VLKSFHNHKNKLLNEIAGTSSAVVEVSTDFRPLTDLLFLVSGNKKIRARVLMWITGQGLMESSFAREKLLKEVKKVADDLASVGDARMRQATKSVGGDRRAVGMRMEHARFANFGSFYGKDSSDLNIDSMDLFSPEAYKKIPILKLIDQEKKMNGKSIFEYWLEKYEPKRCLVNQGDTKNRHFVYDFEEIRKAALDLGLKPFYFGGFNGLIQFMEKGDWKNDVEKKSHLLIRNNQFGISLIPDYREDEKGKRIINKNDLVSFDEDGKGKRPIYHFQGGGIASDEVSATAVINSLHNNFSDLSAAVQRKESEHPDVKDYDSIFQYNLHSLQRARGEDEDQRGRFASALGFENATGRSAWKKLPNLTNLPQEKWKEVFKNILRAGLKLPFRKEVKGTDGYELYSKTFKNEKFPDDSEDYDGWFYYNSKNKTFTFKLNTQQQQEVFDAITKRLDNNQYLARINILHIPSLKDLASKKDGSPDHDQRLTINYIINNAIENDPNLLKDFNVYIASPKKDLSQIRNRFEFIANDEKFELENVNPNEDDLNHPKIKELFEKGFRWNSRTDKPFKGLIEKLNSPEKQIAANPDSDSPDMGSPEINRLITTGFVWRGSPKETHPFKDYKDIKQVEIVKYLVKETEHYQEQYKVTFNKQENKFFLKPIVKKTDFSLTNGPDSFKVSLEFDENNVLKFYFYKPSFKDDVVSLVPRSVAASKKSYSREYPFVGSKDIMFKGGNKTNHFTGNVAGPQDWQTLLQRLKQGRRGGLHEFEKEDPSDRNYDESNLPSVVGGVALAKQWFNQLKATQIDFLRTIGSQLGGRGGKWASDSFDYNDLLAWGFEGLKQYSGTRWFQIGWINDDELKFYIGNYYSKGGKKRNDGIDSEEEYLKQVEKMYGRDYADDIKKLSSRLKGGGGLGILPKLLKKGAIGLPSDGETPENRNEFLKELEKIIEDYQKNYGSREKGKILIDYIREVSDEAADSYAENGFEVRKRMVGKYVLEKMIREVGKLSKSVAMTGFGGGNDDEEGGGVSGFSGSNFSRSSDDTYNTGRQRVSASDLPSGEVVSPDVQPSVVGRIKKVKKNPQASSSFDWSADPADVLKKDNQSLQRSTQNSPVVPQASSSFDWSADPADVLKKDNQSLQRENSNINLLGYTAWKKIQETIGTYAIVSKKPKDGDGYNVWGSLGDPKGVSITGDADTSKIDPIGKKGKIVKRKR
jgi:hypothetical protein